jgi:hypothetical protein
VPLEDAQREQEARRDADAGEPVIADWLIGSNGSVTVGDVLAGALKLEEAKWDKLAQMRVARCLTVLGYRKRQKWVREKPVKVWEKVDRGGYGDVL